MRNSAEEGEVGRCWTFGAVPAKEEPPKIFTQIAKWADNYHPPVGEPMKSSSSAVENYREVPQQYAFSYLWSLKEGPRAIGFGSVVHTTIERFMEQLKKGS